MDILIKNARMTMLLEQDCKRQIHSLPVKTGSMKVDIFDRKKLRRTIIMHCFPLVIYIQSTDLSIYDNRNPKDKHAKYKYPTLSASTPKLTCYVSYFPMNSVDLLNKDCLLK